VTETVFAWPGIGQLAVRAAFERDYPVIMGVVIVISICVCVINLLVDLAYAAVDPRIKAQFTGGVTRRRTAVKAVEAESVEEVYAASVEEVRADEQ